MSVSPCSPLCSTCPLPRSAVGSRANANPPALPCACSISPVKNRTSFSPPEKPIHIHPTISPVDRGIGSNPNQLGCNKSMPRRHAQFCLARHLSPQISGTLFLPHSSVLLRFPLSVNVELRRQRFQLSAAAQLLALTYSRHRVRSSDAACPHHDLGHSRSPHTRRVAKARQHLSTQRSRAGTHAQAQPRASPRRTL